jgi:hypothetical protein
MNVPLPPLLWVLAVAPALAQPAPPVRPAPPAVAAPPAPAEAPGGLAGLSWLPRQMAELKALDKVSTRVADLSVRVGQSAGFGSLTIAVRACVVRPPNEPEDAAAWLDITDSHPDVPQFHGWMVQSAPMLSMLQHPVYDVRLSGCR